MSMISSKLDPVAQNTVWEEHVKKELRTLRQNETYMLTDPRKIDVYPEKPNRIVPRSNPEPALVDQANATLSNMSVLRDTGKAPPERFALPVTANMEYGFFNSVQTKPNPMFTYKMPSSDVTIYADEYVKSNGTGPYNTKAQ